MKPYYKCEYGELYQGDCLEVMPYLSSCGVKVDMVCTDPPYGTTACKWDLVIPMGEMWKILGEVTKKHSPIVLMAGQPFTSSLVMSNVQNFKYSWVWNKKFGANFSLAKYQPIKTHEDICVFGNGSIVYNPQKIHREKPIKLGKNVTKTGSANLAHAKSEYAGKLYFDKNPESIIAISTRSEGQKKWHPTQKPVALIEYLIKTYTNVGNTVLDFTIGSGTTAVAAINTGRRFIGIEKEEKYCEIAAKRIEEAVQLVKNFEV